MEDLKSFSILLIGYRFYEILPEYPAIYGGDECGTGL
jgi:hypothetical protein